MYWNNKTLTGPPAGHATGVGAVDGALTTGWGSGSPLPGVIGADNFSSRFTGTITLPQAGPYTFCLNADDGVRLWIDDQLVLDGWADGFVERTFPACSPTAANGPNSTRRSRAVRPVGLLGRLVDRKMG